MKKYKYTVTQNEWNYECNLYKEYQVEKEHLGPSITSVYRWLAGIIVTLASMVDFTLLFWFSDLHTHNKMNTGVFILVCSVTGIFTFLVFMWAMRLEQAGEEVDTEFQILIHHYHRNEEAKKFNITKEDMLKYRQALEGTVQELAQKHLDENLSMKKIAEIVKDDPQRMCDVCYWIEHYREVRLKFETRHKSEC